MGQHLGCPRGAEFEKFTDFSIIEHRSEDYLEPDPQRSDEGKDRTVATGFCHGNDGTGSRAPDLVRSPLLMHDTNGETIGPVIRNGLPDDGMPAFPFTDQQITDIAAFLHAQSLIAAA